MVLAKFRLLGLIGSLHFATAATLRPQILADTNRDGSVNELDAADKYAWTADRGAIFLPNIGDRQHRCAVVDLANQPLSNHELAACNDASGDILLSPELAAPLLTTPLEGLSPDALGSIYTEPPSTLGRVRIFWKHSLTADNSSTWSLVDPQSLFNATSLSQGLTLAIDARELVFNSSIWDGSANVFFSVTDRNQTRIDSVAMKQAPVLVHHHLQSPNQVLTMDGDATLSKYQPAFVKRLTEVLGGLGNNFPLTLLNGTTEVWAQDFMEPGFASMPGPNGTISLRVLVRSAQSGRVAGRQVFSTLRGPGAGGYQPVLGSGFGWEEINSGGNIETIPPYTSKAGVRYPSGRVILGKHFDKYPAESTIKFFESQGAQTPLFVEAGWLLIGHVDELVQFLPFDNELGWTIAIADTHAALRILEKVYNEGHGTVNAISYDGDMAPDEETILLDPRQMNTTIEMLVSNKEFLHINDYVQGYLNETLKLLLREIPLSEDDVIRVPTLWEDVTYPSPLATSDGQPFRLNRAPPNERQVKSYFPASINGLVLNSDYLAPKPWGPIIDGKDIMEEAIVDVYARANMTVWFINDYMSHHVRGGEVHCGTNTLRDTDVAWWE
ncbi:hypothetical protein B0T10DRAFT_579197 [Thelonectria olida]|uniref:Protein-arginine deiminase C-terminal domain-containing protein n=1 Tax=Thelonectria olida TaxID=1576542 RepID=A0A9P8VZ43_9HYPO|nr:hypothetical protein B0T10DRAFT_579197 [Thelonectria olida]